MNSILLTVLLDIAFAAVPIVAVVYMYRHADVLRQADAIRPVAVLTAGLLVWAAYHSLSAIVMLFGPFFVETRQLPAITGFMHGTLRWISDAVVTLLLAVGFIWFFTRLIEILRGLRSSRAALESEIDSRSEREAELKARANTERAQSQSRSEFMLGLSHELRTPLNGILGLSSLLSNTELDASQRKLLATVERSAQAMLARVSDVLDLARLENNKVVLRSVAFRPDEIAQTVVGLFEPLAGEKGLDLVLDVREGADSPVLGDPGRVRQILNNLMSNALKFTPAGSIVLVVEQPSDKGEKRWVQFQVRDTGVGMDSELLARVSGATGSEAGGDSGLGLSICHRLALLMDGEIEIQSAPGAGTTITARIRVPDEPQAID